MTENQNDGKTADLLVTPSIPDADEATQRMLAAAQRHVVIAAPDGMWWTTRKMAAPLTGVEDLGRHLDRLWEYHSYFQPLGGYVVGTDADGKPRRRFVGEPPQIWVLGDVLDALGWYIPVRERRGESKKDLRDRAREEIADGIMATLDPIIGRDWRVIGKPGYYVHLRKDLRDGTWYRITLVLEAYAWMVPLDEKRREFGILGIDDKQGSQLPEGDDVETRRELTRRLAWCVQHLGVLPSQSPSATGAVILDMDSMRKKNRDDVVETATLLPDLPGMGGRDAEPEPIANWALGYVPNSILYAGGREVEGLIEVDQSASYLASAGMVTVGLGASIFLEGVDSVAEWVMRQKDCPVGLYRVTLPAGRELVESKGIPDAEYREDAPAGRYLPWPHPAMRADEAVTTWVTAPSIDLLREPVESGGAGLTLDELRVDAAHVWEREVFALKGWQRKLRDARAVAIETGDVAMLDYIKSIYRGYIGRMKFADQWAFGGKEHHHQPILRASIIAHARNRGRRWAAKVGAEYDRWPLATDTDSWVYAYHPEDVLWGETWKTRKPEPLHVSTRCGAMVVKRRATLAETDPERLVDLLAVEGDVLAVQAALGAILAHRPARESQEVEE